MGKKDLSKRTLNFKQWKECTLAILKNSSGLDEYSCLSADALVVYDQLNPDLKSFYTKSKDPAHIVELLLCFLSILNGLILTPSPTHTKLAKVSFENIEKMKAKLQSEIKQIKSIFSNTHREIVIKELSTYPEGEMAGIATGILAPNKTPPPVTEEAIPISDMPTGLLEKHGLKFAASDNHANLITFNNKIDKVYDALNELNNISKLYYPIKNENKKTISNKYIQQRLVDSLLKVTKSIYGEESETLVFHLTNTPKAKATYMYYKTHGQLSESAPLSLNTIQNRKANMKNFTKGQKI